MIEYVAKETADTVNKKVAVGELPQIDATRVNVEFSREEAVKKHLELDVVSAKNELASLWSSKTFDYDSIDLVCESFIKQEFKNPSEELINALPEVRLADSQIKVAQADIRKAKAEAGNDNLIALKAFAEIHQHQEHGHDHEDYDHDHEGHDHDHTLATHLVLSMYYIPSPQSELAAWVGAV